MPDLSSWQIKKVDASTEEVLGTLPGNMSKREVEIILQRLVCTTLNSQEILLASLRKDRPERTSLLYRVGSDLPIQYGHDAVFFTASLAHAAPNNPAPG